MRSALVLLVPLLVAGLSACDSSDSRRHPDNGGNDASTGCRTVGTEGGKPQGTGGKPQGTGGASTGTGGASTGTGGSTPGEGGLADSGREAGTPAGTLLRQVEWPGPVVLMADDSPDFVAGLDEGGRLAWSHELGTKEEFSSPVVLTTRTGRVVVVRLPALADGGGNAVSVTTLSGG